MYINAPAKLNLFLEIRARRKDGFHEIETLMTAITLFDTLRFSHRTDNEIQLNCRWASGLQGSREAEKQIAQSPHIGPAPNLGSALEDLPESKDNLVLRVVEGLRVAAGVTTGASIELIKRIPASSGLGGASSDAAAALVAANKVWKLGWSNDQLARFSAQYGSDVPFFFSPGAATCRGRGEIIEPFKQLGKLNFAVVRPPGGLSTAEVYRHVRVPKRAMSVDGILNAFRVKRTDLVARNAGKIASSNPNCFVIQFS